jgi:hypothetical protein
MGGRARRCRAEGATWPQRFMTRGGAARRRCFVGRRCGTRWDGPTGSRGLTRRHGLLALATTLRRRNRAGTSPMPSGLVGGPRWRRSRPARRRPVPAPPAARCPASHWHPRRPTRVLGRRSPRALLEPCGSRRSCGPRRARITGHVEQAPWRVHGSRVQHLRLPRAVGGIGGRLTAVPGSTRPLTALVRGLPSALLMTRRTPVVRRPRGWPGPPP